MVEVRIAAARLLKFDSEVHRVACSCCANCARPACRSWFPFPLGVERASWRSSTTSSCLTSGYGVGLMPTAFELFGPSWRSGEGPSLSDVQASLWRMR